MTKGGRGDTDHVEGTWRDVLKVQGYGQALRAVGVGAGLFGNEDCRMFRGGMARLTFAEGDVSSEGRRRGRHARPPSQPRKVQASVPYPRHSGTESCRRQGWAFDCSRREGST